MEQDRDLALVVRGIDLGREFRDRLCELQAELGANNRSVALPSGPTFNTVDLEVLQSQLDKLLKGLERYRRQMEDTLRLKELG